MSRLVENETDAIDTCKQTRRWEGVFGPPSWTRVWIYIVLKLIIYFSIYLDQILNYIINQSD